MEEQDLKSTCMKTQNQHKSTGWISSILRVLKIIPKESEEEQLWEEQEEDTKKMHNVAMLLSNTVTDFVYEEDQSIANQIERCNEFLEHENDIGGANDQHSESSDTRNIQFSDFVQISKSIFQFDPTFESQDKEEEEQKTKTVTLRVAVDITENDNNNKFKFNINDIKNTPNSVFCYPKEDFETETYTNDILSGAETSETHPHVAIDVSAEKLSQKKERTMKLCSLGVKWNTKNFLEISQQGLFPPDMHFQFVCALSASDPIQAMTSNIYIPHLYNIAASQNPLCILFSLSPLFVSRSKGNTDICAKKCTVGWQEEEPVFEIIFNCPKPQDLVHIFSKSENIDVKKEFNECRQLFADKIYLDVVFTFCFE